MFGRTWQSVNFTSDLIGWLQNSASLEGCFHVLPLQQDHVLLNDTGVGGISADGGDT